jgi:hypothetical protein
LIVLGSGGLQSSSSFISGFFHKADLALGFTVSSCFGGLNTSSGRDEGIFGSVLSSSSFVGKLVSCGDFASNLFLLRDGIFRVFISSGFGSSGKEVTLSSSTVASRSSLILLLSSVHGGLGRSERRSSSCLSALSGKVGLGSLFSSFS